MFTNFLIIEGRKLTIGISARTAIDWLMGVPTGTQDCHQCMAIALANNLKTFSCLHIQNIIAKFTHI